MKKFIQTISLLLLLTNCADEKNRDNFHKATKICSGLTMEMFKLKNTRADNTPIYGEWLTDSATFREFIGTTEMHYNTMRIECQGDTLIITKRDTIKDLDVKTFRVSSLKSLNNYR